MPYCVKCGSEMPQDAQFCPICGAPATTGRAPAPPTYTQPRTVASSLPNRMIRAAKLDTSLYEEVEADEGATTQAVIVILLSSFCSGIGTAIGSALTGKGTGAIGLGLFGGLLSALIGWFIWSFITYFVGTNVFGGTASFAELLRTIGFSDSPGVLLFFSFIPILGGLLSAAVSIWMLVAMIVAVRQALDFSTGKAILTCIVGWIAMVVLLIVVGILLAIPFFILGL